MYHFIFEARAYFLATVSIGWLIVNDLQAADSNMKCMIEDL